MDLNINRQFVLVHRPLKRVTLALKVHVYPLVRVQLILLVIVLMVMMVAIWMLRFEALRFHLTAVGMQ